MIDKIAVGTINRPMAAGNYADVIDELKIQVARYTFITYIWKGQNK